MSKPNKQKIDTNPSQTGLNSAFASAFGGLNTESLPAGPETQETAATPAKPAKLGRVLLRKEKAHRGGKTVIIVHDFAPEISGDYIDTLCAQLRKSCGCGGTTRDREIEIQGDQPGRIRTFLEKEGFRVGGVQ